MYKKLMSHEPGSTLLAVPILTARPYDSQASVYEQTTVYNSGDTVEHCVSLS